MSGFLNSSREDAGDALAAISSQGLRVYSTARNCATSRTAGLVKRACGDLNNEKIVTAKILLRACSLDVVVMLL